MSLMVDDFLAFPECAISCVSVLNSVCFASRHELSKISDLSAILIRGKPLFKLLFNIDLLIWGI